MTPKDKAIELLSKFLDEQNHTEELSEAKQCSLICVDEILSSNPCMESKDRGCNFEWTDNTYYWEEVKQEIEKL